MVTVAVSQDDSNGGDECCADDTVVGHCQAVRHACEFMLRYVITSNPSPGAQKTNYLYLRMRGSCVFTFMKNSLLRDTRPPRISYSIWCKVVIEDW